MTNEQIADAAVELGVQALMAALAVSGAPLPLATVARVVAMATVDAIVSGALPMPAVAIVAQSIEIVDEAAPPSDT